ncbi:unnamed protein product [Didymodactylos carnosus]|uniref:VWFA domain-containing protein n=1 Tax=Didymodactylos carnosus TaxID=1234261 RepID=A0A815IMT3_9BILA|nr:unnamed protein product [Didymodactylos carnosus]CAF4256535.1 unnamed protein product [Didymodactylos carnosus]
MRNISDLCNIIYPTNKEKLANDALIEIIENINSMTTITQFQVLELGIQLTNRLRDSINKNTTLDHLNTLLETYRNLIPVMNGELTRLNIKTLIDHTTDLILDQHIKQFLRTISKVIHTLNNNKNITMNIVIELFDIIPDQQLSDHIKCILLSAPEILNGDIKQKLVDLAQQILTTEFSDMHDISLSKILDQGKTEQIKALKSIAALLPEELRPGFNDGIKQLTSPETAQEQVVQKIRDLYGSKTGNALQISFNALNSLKSDKLQALKQLSRLLPNEHAKTIFDTAESISQLKTCELKDVVKTILELASVMAPKKTSKTLQNVVNVYQKLANHQGIDAIKDALRLLPYVREQAHKMVDALAKLAKQEITHENLLNCAFNAAMGIVNEKTAKTLAVTQNVINQIQNRNLQGAVHQIAKEHFPEYATKIDTAMTITNSATRILSQTNDPLQAFNSLLNNDELKSRLPPEIQQVYGIAQELRTIVNHKDSAKQELTKHALKLGSSFLPPEYADKVDKVVSLIDSFRSKDPKKIVDQSMTTITTLLPPKINNAIRPVILLLHKKLNNKRISYEDMMDGAGSFISDKGQQIMKAAKPLVSALINGKRLSGDQYLDLLGNLMTVIDVDNYGVDFVQKAKIVYENVRKIIEDVSTLMKAATLASKAACISSLAAAALILLEELTPSIPDSVKIAINIICAVALLLTATNPVGFVLVAIILAFTLFDAFKRLGGCGGGGNGDGDSGCSGGANDGSSSNGGNRSGNGGSASSGGNGTEGSRSDGSGSTSGEGTSVGDGQSDGRGGNGAISTAGSSSCGSSGTSSGGGSGSNGGRSSGTSEGGASSSSGDRTSTSSGTSSSTSTSGSRTSGTSGSNSCGASSSGGGSARTNSGINRGTVKAGSRTSSNSDISREYSSFGSAFHSTGTSFTGTEIPSHTDRSGINQQVSVDQTTQGNTSRHTISFTPTLDASSVEPSEIILSESTVPQSPFLMGETFSTAGEAVKTEVETLAREAAELSQESEKKVSHIMKQEELLLSETITCLMAANNMRQEIKSLAQTTLPSVIKTSLQLYQLLQQIEKCSGDINGHIKRKCQEIQKDLIQTLDKLSESKSLRKMWKLSKKNELVDNYDIPEDGHITDLNYQAQDQRQQTNLDNMKQLIQGFEDSKFEQGKIIGNSTLHKLGIPLDNLVPNDLNSVHDDDNDDTKGSSEIDPSTPPTADRDITLEIDDQGIVKSTELEKPLAKVETMYVQFQKNIDGNSATTDTKPKENSSKITITKEQLENLKKDSADKFQNLLQLVNEYDIGQISEDCRPEDLPDTKLDKPRYALLARLTRNIQNMLLTRLRSALKNQYKNQQQQQFEQTMSDDNLQFEFVFCVDNSGSMNGRKIREALNILVILMETFHRLEWKFAVVRFGAEQKILKALGRESMHDTVRAPTSATATTITTTSLEQILIAREHVRFYSLTSHLYLRK